ncbi:MAG: hypothetical protein II578_00200, partial [Bacteroidaceae bacterium]|nr:hypothetical protein [Bacteroidaceae bacterium]
VSLHHGSDVFLLHAFLCVPFLVHDVGFRREVFRLQPSAASPFGFHVCGQYALFWAFVVF